VSAVHRVNLTIRETCVIAAAETTRLMLQDILDQTLSRQLILYDIINVNLIIHNLLPSQFQDYNSLGRYIVDNVS
jgi:hypothetical protein